MTTNAQVMTSLKRAWELYGHVKNFAHLMVKIDRDCYAVLGWKEGDMVVIADMARGSVNDEWEMQNDGSEPVTMAQWNALRIPEGCDWYVIPDEEDIELEQHEKQLEKPNSKYSKAFEIYKEGFDDAYGHGYELLGKWFKSTTYSRVKK